mmetsp:Transcript_49799/g.100276  ORF Transcript_49799/g.100276 Transcript_49799/m.100276 type:complete len:259 (-) Transcript_49799:938-1714(-)
MYSGALLILFQLFQEGVLLVLPHLLRVQGFALPRQDALRLDDPELILACQVGRDGQKPHVLPHPLLDARKSRRDDGLPLRLHSVEVELVVLLPQGEQPLLVFQLPLRVLSRHDLLGVEVHQPSSHLADSVLLQHRLRQSFRFGLELRLGADCLDGVAQLLGLQLPELLRVRPALDVVEVPGVVELVREDRRDDGRASRRQGRLQRADAAMVYSGLALREEQLVGRSLDEEDVLLAPGPQLLLVLRPLEPLGPQLRPTS